MRRPLSSFVRLAGGFLFTASSGLLLNVGVAAAAPLSTPPAGGPACSTLNSASAIVATTSAAGNPTLPCVPQPGQVVVIVFDGTTDPRLAALNVPSPANVASPDQMTGLTDPRIDTYAKRQAIRDQYRGRINVTTFNDELGDGVSLDQALSDALRELNAK